MLEFIFITVLLFSISYLFLRISKKRDRIRTLESERNKLFWHEEEEQDPEDLKERAEAARKAAIHRLETQFAFAKPIKLAELLDMIKHHLEGFEVNLDHSLLENGIGSVDAVEFLLDIEERFGVAENDELATDIFNLPVKDLIDILEMIGFIDG